MPKLEGSSKVTLDELLAKTAVGFRSVMKLYFQWFGLIYYHGLAFFFLPMHGTLRFSQQAYCPVDEAGNVGEGEPCNQFNRSPSLIGFYVLCCMYFWVSAL